MAKIVTLKSPSDEDIYPVTDASGIRVTGDLTLQQALDGFVYADDPTAPANPNAWITPSDIDWSTFTYSTSEQRVGTWIDGKPIYKKTVDFGALPNATVKQVSHGIANMARAVKIEGIIQMGASAWTSAPLVYRGGDSAYNAEFQVTTTYVHCATDHDRSGSSAIITIYYTKTTD